MLVRAVVLPLALAAVLTASGCSSSQPDAEENVATQAAPAPAVTSAPTPAATRPPGPALTLRQAVQRSFRDTCDRTFLTPHFLATYHGLGRRDCVSDPPSSRLAVDRVTVRGDRATVTVHDAGRPSARGAELWRRSPSGRWRLDGFDARFLGSALVSVQPVYVPEDRTLIGCVGRRLAAGDLATVRTNVLASVDVDGVLPREPAAEVLRPCRREFVAMIVARLVREQQDERSGASVVRCVRREGNRRLAPLAITLDTLDPEAKGGFNQVFEQVSLQCDGAVGDGTAERWPFVG